MITHADSETVRQALEVAGRAPSLHNSQPWQFDVHEDRIDLYANLQRWLPATDADRRDLMLSCGAALHHLRLGLANGGIGERTHRLPVGDDADLLASVEIGGPVTIDARPVGDIPRRRSDRRPFRHWPIPSQFITELAEQATEQGAILRVVAEPPARTELLRAFADTEIAQGDVVGYNAELTIWTGLGSGSDGVPAANLPEDASPGVAAQRTFDRGELPVTASGSPDDDTLLVLGTASDDRLSQLRAGEALSAVLLRATHLGLASCPLSQPLESASTREVLRDRVLGGTLTPQIVLRLGWPQTEALPATPRRTLEETVGRVPR